MTHNEYVNMSVRTIGMPKFDLSRNYLDKTTGKLKITTFWLGYVNDDVVILDRSWVYYGVKGNTKEKISSYHFANIVKKIQIESLRLEVRLGMPSMKQQNIIIIVKMMLSRMYAIMI